MSDKTLNELKEEILLLMDYNSPTERRRELEEVLERYKADFIGLNVLHHFYSFLPEAQEDGITILRTLAQKEGTFLFSASTFIDNYVYIATSERAELLGTCKEGFWETEVLDFFGYTSREDFITKHRETSESPEYTPVCLDDTLCPVCAVVNGEMHTFGCPVEICPWCGGQLTNCGCRFAKLGIDKLDKDADIDLFFELVTKKGRIPYNIKQRPVFLRNLEK